MVNPGWVSFKPVTWVNSNADPEEDLELLSGDVQIFIIICIILPIICHKVI